MVKYPSFFYLLLNNRRKGDEVLQLQFVERLKGKVQKENLWFFILLLLSSGDRYGYELRRLINDRFGFWSGKVTAYRVLYDLEKARLVKAERSSSSERRRYYKITEAGRREIDGAIAFLESLVKEKESK
jgi:DNA-binding PadR family transcriptional regulator